MVRPFPVRGVVSLVVLGLCGFLAVSLATFDANDLAAYHMPPASPVHNSGGVLGARVADFLWQGMGYGTILLIALAVGWSALSLAGRGAERIALRAVGAVLLVACACTFAQTAGSPRGLVGCGGTVGMALGDLVQHYFGAAGQWMLGIPLTMLALMLLSVDEFLVPPVLRVAAASATVLRKFRSRARSRRRSG